MTRFASQTQTAVGKTRAEIERTLRRYGATGFAYGWLETRASIMFEMAGRRVRFELPLPVPSEFATSPGGRTRSTEACNAAHDQAVRQRWRALALIIKAKLEAVESKIVVFDSEFMAHIVMPDGRTMGEHAVPQIGIAYKVGKLPPLLGYHPGGVA